MALRPVEPVSSIHFWPTVKEPAGERGGELRRRQFECRSGESAVRRSDFVVPHFPVGLDEGAVGVALPSTAMQFGLRL